MASTDKPASATVVSPPGAAPGALPFRGDTADLGFPWAGTLLMVVLVGVAVAARWYAVRHGRVAAGAGFTRWLRPATAAGLPTDADVRVESSIRLDAQTQLHTLRWGERRLLLATSSHAAPVVLDRVDVPASSTEVHP